MKIVKHALFFVLTAFVLMLNGQLKAQAIYEDGRYVPETDPLVLKKLEQWQGLKFGLLMHWGAYSQWGIVESWSICPEEYGWCDRTKGKNSKDYFAYKKDYENLKNTFNPVKFNPDKWASAAKKAGMKYVVFTTKHHDGFSMFDTNYTSYKVTDPDCPFSQHPKSNITKEIFSAFRKQGFWTGAYFSKPDWHSPYYWDPYYPPKDRNVNYDPAVYPEKWEKFKNFTHNQIMELMSDYGQVDILWLDGGWVEKLDKQNIIKQYNNSLKNDDNGYLKSRIINQDIDMDGLVAKARQKQPGLIVVDRAVHGKNQNYLTPENRVPDKPLPYPWESCIIAGGGWSYTFDAKYMSSHQVVHTLVDIVSKGGNLLLNLAPSPLGELDEGAYKLLDDIGSWMQINHDAIYDTKSIAPYQYKNICLTSKADGSLYMIYLVEEHQKNLPSEVYFEGYVPKKLSKAKILGFKPSIKWHKKGNGLVLKIPKSLKSKLLKTEAFVIKIK